MAANFPATPRAARSNACDEHVDLQLRWWLESSLQSVQGTPITAAHEAVSQRLNS
jgi:hypothetical protein